MPEKVADGGNGMKIEFNELIFNQVGNVRNDLEDGKWYVFTDGVYFQESRFKMDALDHFYPKGEFFALQDAKGYLEIEDFMVQVSRHYKEIEVRYL